LRLRELEEEGARLRRKSVRLDEEISKIKIRLAQTGYTKMRLRGSDLAGPPKILE